MNVQLHKRFLAITIRINNTLTEVKSKIGTGMAFKDCANTIKELFDEFSSIRKEVLDEAEYSFTGNNLPEIKETIRKYTKRIKDAFKPVCINFPVCTDHVICSNLTQQVVPMLEDYEKLFFEASKRFSKGKQRTQVDNLAIEYAGKLEDLFIRLSNKAIEFDEAVNTKGEGQNQTVHNLEDIFFNDAAKRICYELFEDLQITINGIYAPHNANNSRIAGAIIAMKQTPNFFKVTLNEKPLINLFNLHFKTNIHRYKKESDSYKEGYDDARRFLKTSKV